MSGTVIFWIIATTLVKFVLSPPTAAVNWVVRQFEIHKKLEADDVTITFKGQEINGEEKQSILESYNEAIFLKRNPIFKGNEEAVLHPETTVVPYIIKTKNRKKELNLYLYHNEQYVDVVKQCKKNVVSYTLNSEKLHEVTLPGGAAA